MSRHAALRRDDRGGAMVEFALIVPVFLLLLLGGLEMAHTLYVRSILIGQLQKAAREISLEDASADTRQAAIFATVRDAVHMVVPGADVQLVARSYHDYANAKNPAEEFNDANHDGVCNNGESFVDANRNGTWDRDGSIVGRGGAKDVVLLEATVRYDRLPLGRLFAGDPTTSLAARTLIRNQPNDQQADPPSGTCP